MVADILGEAARWLEQAGILMWRDDELGTARIAAEVAAGLFFLAECGGEAVGTVKFQLEDPVFWPDVPQRDAAYIHRLAVRRHYAGGSVSSALCGPALRAVLGPGQYASALEFKVSFIRPARAGALIGRGRIVHRGRSTAFLEAELRNADGELVATAATGRIVTQRKQRLENC